VGIAGGPEKCKWLTDTLGLDAAIDYKSENVAARIAETCPNGVNVFFDNVGGEILEAALDNMAQNGRIVLCGGISAYNEENAPPGPRNYMQLVIRRCRMEGFIVIDYLSRMPEAVTDLAKWAASGDLIAEVDVQEGFENVPGCLLRLFEGRNLGKQLCRIAEPA
jgi:NADPH-dependent curcumin reductase CurA